MASKRMRAVAVLALALAGCVSYRPQVLPATPHWAAAPTSADGRVLRRLDLAQASRVALRQNPDYRAALASVQVSTQQLREAGLLPDPQLSASADHPTTPGYSQAWSLGLGEDLSWLLTRGAALDAARAQHLSKVLQVAWQGWTLSQRTARDYIDLWAAQQRCALLDAQHAGLRRLADANQAALATHDVTLQDAGASLLARADLESRLGQARQARAAAQAALDADLGLAPDAHYTLVAPEAPSLPDARELRAALVNLPRTRPDLLALRAAAQARDAEFRAAVLAQFPGLGVSINRASDTSRVQSTGLAITLDLPLFGGAQARARVARATRAEAEAQYQARLDRASAGAQALAAQLREVAAQRARLQHELPQLRQLAARARAAYRHGDLQAYAWASAEQSVMARELDAIDLAATEAKGAVALAALLGHVPPGAPAPATLIPGSKR